MALVTRGTATDGAIRFRPLDMDDGYMVAWAVMRGGYEVVGWVVDDWGESLIYVRRGGLPVGLTSTDALSAGDTIEARMVGSTITVTNITTGATLITAADSTITESGVWQTDPAFCEFVSFEEVEEAPTGEHVSWTDLGPAPSTLSKRVFSPEDTVGAGGTLYYDPLDPNRVHIVGDITPRLYQTPGGVAIANATNSVMFVTSWMAADYSKPFRFECETYTTDPNANAALLYYPSEAVYSHATRVGDGQRAYVTERPSRYIEPQDWPRSGSFDIPSNNLRWLKRGFEYRYEAGNAYLRPFTEKSDGTLYYGSEFLAGAVDNFPHPAIGFHVWSSGALTAVRNMKTTSGAFAAYGVEPTRVSGMMAVGSTSVNGSTSWVYQGAGTWRYHNGAVALYMAADAIGRWYIHDGAATNQRLEFPQVTIPQGRKAKAMRVKAKNIEWILEDENGAVIASGTTPATDTITEIQLPAATTVRPVAVLRDTSSQVSWLDMSWDAEGYSIITIAATSGGAVSASQLVDVQPDTPSNFTATPDPGYIVASVTASEGVTVTPLGDNEYAVTASQHGTVTVTFAEPTRASALMLGAGF